MGQVAHSHTNKALLDTYTQTEADLADAVAKNTRMQIVLRWIISLDQVQ